MVDKQKQYLLKALGDLVTLVTNLGLESHEINLKIIYNDYDSLLDKLVAEKVKEFLDKYFNEFSFYIGIK